MDIKAIEKQIVTPFFEVHQQPTTNYKSLFARQDFEANIVLSTFSYQEKSTIPNRYSVQINETEHIILSPLYLQYINHSCSPNVFFDTTTMELKTLRAIKLGEELAFFYPSTEWKMTEVFNCVCGSPECLGQIRGAAYLTYDILKKHRFSKYILDKYQNI